MPFKRLLPWQHPTPLPKFYHITKLPDKFEELGKEVRYGRIILNCLKLRAVLSWRGHQKPPPPPPKAE